MVLLLVEFFQKWTTASDFNHYVTLSKHSFKKRGSDRQELSSIVLCVGNYHYIRDVVQVQKEKSPPLKPSDCHISLKLSSTTFKPELDEFEGKNTGGPYFDKNGLTVPYSAFLTLLSDDSGLKEFFREVLARYEEDENELAGEENSSEAPLVNFVTPKTTEVPIPSPPQKKRKRQSIFFAPDDEKIIIQELENDPEFGAQNTVDKTTNESDENIAGGGDGGADDDDDDDEIISRKRRTNKKKLIFDGLSDSEGEEEDQENDDDFLAGAESEAEGDPNHSADFEPLVLTQAASAVKKGRGRGGRGKK